MVKIRNLLLEVTHFWKTKQSGNLKGNITWLHVASTLQTAQSESSSELHHQPASEETWILSTKHLTLWDNPPNPDLYPVCPRLILASLILSHKSDLWLKDR